MRRFTPTRVEQIGNLLHALGAGVGPRAGRQTQAAALSPWDNQTYINNEENAH